MGTHFEDFPVTNEADFFSEQAFPFGKDDTEEEKKIIKDGNDEILRKMEAWRMNGDYARSQISRNKKAPTFDMGAVDWSGFSAAAHQGIPEASGKKHRPIYRRRSLQESRGDQEKLSLRTQRRLSSHGSTHGASTTQYPPAPNSSKFSPNIYRSRRQKAKVDAVREFDASNHGGEHPRRKRSDKSGREQGIRPRRCGQNGRSKSRSKSRTREGKTRNRSASPTSTLRSSNHAAQRSASPLSRLNRPPAPAAASSTLDVGSKTRKKGTPRSIALRKRSTQKANGDSIFQKAASLKW